MEKEKPKRAYNATRRQEQAQETRRLIVEAARGLFIARGYTGTTIQAIAEQAGVAAETIYAAFGNKRTILSQVVDNAVRGDLQPAGILERSEPQAVRQETDQRRQLHLFAQSMSQIMERVSPIFEVMRLAAKSEPEVAELLQRIFGQRLQNMVQVAEWLAANGPLRVGMDAPLAGETIWALSGPDMYRLLTVDRNWSRDRFAQWLEDMLIVALLPANAG